jgi:hypothetical protein
LVYDTCISTGELMFIIAPFLQVIEDAGAWYLLLEFFLNFEKLILQTVCANSREEKYSIFKTSLFPRIRYWYLLAEALGHLFSAWKKNCFYLHVCLVSWIFLLLTLYMMIIRAQLKLIQHFIMYRILFLSFLEELTYLVHMKTLWGKYHCSPHYTEEEIDSVICFKSHS